MMLLMELMRIAVSFPSPPAVAYPTAAPPTSAAASATTARSLAFASTSTVTAGIPSQYAGSSAGST